MAAVFAVGVGGSYFAMQQTDEYSATISSSSGMMMGHVTATAINGDGEIFAYRQSDNAIVERGMELIAGQLFEGLNGTGDYGQGLAIGGSPVDAIGIGTSAAAVTSEDTSITEPAWPNRCQNVTVAWTAGTVNVTRGYSLGGVAMIGINGSAQFGPNPALCGGGNIYTEAGAFDNDTSGAMFARNTFNAVTLGNPDSLIINWNFQFNDS